MLEILIGNTIVAAVLALVVLFFCRLFHPGPATRHALWFVVVLKLLSPVGLLWQEQLPFERPAFLTESSTSPAPSPVARKEKPQPVYVLVSTEDVAFPDLAVAGPVRAEWVAEEPEPLAALPAAAPVTPAPSHLRDTLYWWFILIWLSGALVVAARYAQRTLRFARYARSGKDASSSLQRQVDELAARLGVRAPAVRVLPDLPSPVVWCLFRPVLLWPKGLQDQLSGEGRRAVIVHELAHLVRKDHWFRWLELAAAVMHWWNPLFWLARRQMRFHAELACDAWVTGTLPDDRRAYAEALLEVCARTNRAAAPSPAVGVGGEGRRDFQRRLTMIMRDRVPCRLAAGAKMLVVLAAIAALPAWTLGQAKREPLPAPKVEAATAAAAEELTFDTFALAQHGDFGEFDVELVLDGNVDDAKAKEIQARIAELQKQLKAIHDAKAAADKAKSGQPFEFRLAAPKPAVAEQQIKIIIIGPDGKVIEWGGDKNAPVADVLKWVPKMADVKPIIQPLFAPKVEDRRVRIIRFAPDGKIIEGGGEAAKPVEVKPLPPIGGLGIKVEVEAVDGKQPRIKVVGPDGKEIKDIKILIDKLHLPGLPAAPAVKPMPPTPPTGLPARIELKVEEPAQKPEERRFRIAVAAPESGAKPIALTRATYKLPKQKAETLAAFLKANVKASVLELKVDDNGLTVTTTPEAQSTIGGLVKLMQTGGDVHFHYELKPSPKK